MKRSTQGLGRLVLFFGLWIALVAAGIAWVVRSSGTTVADLRQLVDLSGATLTLLAMLCVGLYAADVARYRLLGEALGTTVTWRAALDASVANYFFGWITPGTALGAPAAIVMLARRGVPWDAAAVIALCKSITGTAFVLLLGFAALAAGLGPDFGPEVRWVLVVGSGLVFGMMAIPIVGAFLPRRTVALIDRLEARLAGRRKAGRLLRGIRTVATGLRRTIERLARLRAGGLTMVTKISLLHLAYFVAFIGVPVVLALALGATSWIETIGISTIFVAFSYVAPTPGGAGLSEASALLFYGSLLPPPEAVAVVLLSRVLTFYLQVAVGIVYLPFAGGLGDVLSYRADHN